MFLQVWIAISMCFYGECIGGLCSLEAMVYPSAHIYWREVIFPDRRRKKGRGVIHSNL